MIGEWRTFTFIKTLTFHNFIQRSFKDKDKVWIENIFVLYGFDSDIFCSIYLLFLYKDDELNDDKYFLILFTSKYSVICNMLLWIFWPYISGIIDSFTFS